MALPDVSMRHLLEAGAHFGHQTHRWNPRMEPYIFGARNGIHIVDLSQTAPLLHQALKVVRDAVASGGRVLFVGTKRQASGPVAEAAKRCAQFYMNHRWLGGTLTNWKTVSNSIRRLRELEELLVQEQTGLTKKETLQLTRERDKLDMALGGIKEMGGLPDVMIVIDTGKEKIAVAEARKLGIPVIGICDTNADPTVIDHPIPANDDALRAINLYCDLFSQAVLDGIQAEMGAADEDIGALEQPIEEPVIAAEEAEAAAEAAPAAAEEAPAAEAGAEEAGEAPKA
ncbi:MULTISPECIES: 30S ribosomal protein S2 [unclassified Minwuia]|jgi:small subunit ribosomal protein S2|uniref:30S ribosomal protein S2 n=1 Tax=unclassified Minwuia TaxID=2618799 RepID=UPI0024783883|nr:MULTISPECIES: 30S ribosomal protein S2 [unclassified Minwuia]